MYAQNDMTAHHVCTMLSSMSDFTPIAFGFESPACTVVTHTTLITLTAIHCADSEAWANNLQNMSQGMEQVISAG